MKISGARNEPTSPLRRRAPEAQAAATTAAAAPKDTVEILGVPAAEMTPAVRAAIQTLMGELNVLREEVGRLRARLAAAEEAADRDALTPLLNRRAFLRELQRADAFARRYGAPASLVYFDLDGLKAINDAQGHAAGDAALRAVGERLRAHVRESDIVGRLGGDEFAVVLIQADRATAEAKAAALAHEIEREPVGFGGGTLRLRVSYGISEVCAAAGPEAMISDADAAMYAAKRLRKAG